MSATDPTAAPAAAWTTVSPWDGLLHPGRVGAPDGPAGVRVWPAQPADAVTLAVAPGGRDALAAALAAATGIALPGPNRLARGSGLALRWTGPGQWLATADTAGAATRLGTGLAGVAEAIAQGSARATLRLTGPRARDALAKGCVVDLDPRVFGPGAVALTTVAHMAVHLVRVDDGAAAGDAVYELSAGRSLAGSLWHWLRGAVEEYGAEVLATAP